LIYLLKLFISSASPSYQPEQRAPASVKNSGPPASSAGPPRTSAKATARAGPPPVKNGPPSITYLPNLTSDDLENMMPQSLEVLPQSVFQPARPEPAGAADFPLDFDDDAPSPPDSLEVLPQTVRH
jgi:hypothetical protein